MKTKEWRKKRDETRAWLHQRFPDAFRAKGAVKMPLKTGIHVDLAVALKDCADAPERFLIRAALADYTSGPTYLISCVEGADRVGLHGEASGIVTQSESSHALSAMRRSLAGMKAATARTPHFERLTARLEAAVLAREAA